MVEYFGKIDNLTAFTNTDFNMKFDYMSEAQSLNMARVVLQKFKETGYKNIVVIESGTAPLIELIKKLDKNLNFIQIKIPRDMDFNFEKFVQTVEQLNNIRLQELFNSEFLVFDEYINSGTVINNFDKIVKMFNPFPKYHIAAYCVLKEKFDVAFSIYNKETELECYKIGAYPFENRVDIIGYYYFINENNFEKIYLSELLNKFSKKGNISFYNILSRFISKHNLVSKLKSYCQEKEVRDYVSKLDIGRYILKLLEKNPKYADFLDQIFEIYAPAWSPMPTKNHLDYWQAFARLSLDVSELEESYAKQRHYIFNDILSKMITNRNQWLKKIGELI